MTSPLRVLHLEDCPDDAMLIRRKLRAEFPRSEVIRVDDEAGFRAALNTGSLDLILSDYRVPAFHGMTALALARDVCPEVPFLFLSGVLGDELAVDCLKAGATDYLLKDRPARLVPAIRRALAEADVRAKRKQASLALERSIREYEVLVNAIDGIVWQAHLPDLRFSFVSRQAERILGYPTRCWLEDGDFWRDHIHPEDRERAIALCRELTPEQKYQSFEYRMLAADGRVVWLRDLISVRAEKAERPQLQGIMVDITVVKLAEEKTRHIQAQLEQRNRDLLKKNQEIQNFYHTLSHELKTPLTSATEFIAIVLDGLGGPVNDTQKEYLGIAKESCTQLRDCINDLLDATRLETGKFRLQIKPASLDALVHRVLTTFQPAAQEKKITLTEELQPGLPVLPLDEHRMVQVITNLVGNALKFTPPGGSILAKVREAPRSAELVEFSVRDTGCGIPKAEQEHIFDRLYQVKTGDSATGGVGLGLYLCRELVQLHGGNIWVESEPESGSTFAFVIPKSPHLLRPNLLVADDDPELLATLQELLQGDYNVRLAKDGVEAIEQIEQQVPDILVLDLAMPRQDGPATLKEIRERWSSLPVIVHTGYAESELLNQALAYSPFTLLAKPCEPEKLFETLRKVQRAGDTAVWKKNHQGLPKLQMN